MEGRVIGLYSDSDKEKLRQKIKLWSIGLSVFGAISLAVCALSAAFVTTANAAGNERLAVFVAIISGWIIIYCVIYLIGGARKELSHAQTLSDGGAERVAGSLTLTGERMTIRNSVDVLGCEVLAENGRRHFWVAASRAKKLKNARVCAVYAVHGYIAAVEVQNEDP